MNLTVNQSSQATFSCTAQGNPVPTISWTGPSASFTTEVTPGANFTVLSMLTIDSAVRAVHEGLYTCSASNGVGSSPNSSAELTVQGTAGDPPPHNTRSTTYCACHTPDIGTALHFHFLIPKLDVPQHPLQGCHSSPDVLPPPPPSPSVPPIVQAVQGRIVGILEMNVTLSFTNVDAYPEVRTENIQWTFSNLNGSSFDIPTNSVTTNFSILTGVFSGHRLSLTLSGLTSDFEGMYTMTATNEAGSDSATVELVIEGQCATHHIVMLTLCLYIVCK